MNRDQALDKANAIVSEWLDPPKNGRGYPVDGWKPITATERATIVVQIAEFLWEPETKLVTHTDPGSVFGATVFGWPLDGNRPPTKMEYELARDTIRRIGPNGIVTAAEAEALNSLIAAYERLPQPPEPPPVAVS